MKSPLIPLLLGAVFIAGAVGINIQQRALQRSDTRDVLGLRAELDSVVAAIGRATTAADSARLRESRDSRYALLARREFHIPARQAAIDGWWSLGGPGSLLTVVGILFVAVAIVQRRQAAR